MCVLWQIVYTDGAMGIVDSGTSLLVGPPEIISPILERVKVEPDCSNMKDVSQHHFLNTFA